jgi:CubicO group peptidase (beta-lactamase class C family)
MRLTLGPVVIVMSIVSACGSSRVENTPLRPKFTDGSPASASRAAPVAGVPELELLSADTPRTTARGTSFVAPKGWRIGIRGAATLLELPEKGLRMAVVDVDAKDADAAAEAAWDAYGAPRRKLENSTDGSNREGWRDTRKYSYETSSAEQREVYAVARRSSGEQWTVVIEDVSVALDDERFAQRKLVHRTLLPKGFERESFAGKKALRLGPSEIAELRKFVTKAQDELGIPGISIGVVQDGKVAFAGGFGVRELGKQAPVDENTLFMIASQTKPLTTLMLAKLVEEGKFSWETPVVHIYPPFKFKSEETTASIRLKHLVCACTGTPRKDWSVLEFRTSTPQRKLDELAAFALSSEPGEKFHYSDLLVAAAGFVGGHAAYPDLELGAAYDKALQTRVLRPLGMTATTLDHRLALRRPNRASAHSAARNGKQTPALKELNELLIAQRPAGGAWSNVTDMLKYVQMELATGKLPDGKLYVAEEPLLARRASQVSVDEYQSYALGLWLEHRYGIQLLHHGGDVIGYHSEMVWLPEHGVGSVILTNGDPGWWLIRPFRRKLLELLFGGRSEADESVSARAQSFHAKLAEKRKLVSLPVDPTDAAKLAPRYANDELGELTVRHDGPAVVFDFGEWTSEVASRRNPDGSVSFRAVDAGSWVYELEFTTGDGAKRTLKVRDPPYEYTFTER